MLATLVVVCLWLVVQCTDWSHDRRCAVIFNERNDCGHIGTSKGECEEAGCCWRPAPPNRPGVPWCFHPQHIESKYYVASSTRADGADLMEVRHRSPETDPNAESMLQAQVKRQGDIIHIKITSPNHIGVPPHLYEEMKGYPMHSNNWEDSATPSLEVQFEKDPFQFTIIRTSDYSTLFSTKALDIQDPFDSITMKHNFVQLGTRLPKPHFIYGLGERASKFRRAPRRMAMNARDTPALEDQNSYGSHPFYMEMRPGGQAHGVLMLNSHPMEVELTENALVYRLLGGAIDMYFFAGPTPYDVVEQYTRIIGRPPLMEPKFFGLHQCRYGYDTLEHWKEVTSKFDEHQVPLDGICYMDNKDIFTIDEQKYPLDKTRKFIAEQEEKGRFIVTIIDPGVSIKPDLPAYALGVQSDVFLRAGNTDEYYEGRVWPGPVHFIDFLSPQTTDYWHKLIADFKRLVPFAGLWLDMSEPASFSHGHREHYPTLPYHHTQYNLNYPPFAINNGDGQIDIFLKTISMDARHVDGTNHLSVHNLYGVSESYQTAVALERIDPGRRHFLLTRSTFPGSGRFTAHWLGDNYSDFTNMQMSISGAFDFQLFGIPMVGADLCGFLDASNEELCARWMALGAFMPFARNHNAERPDNIPQEPYRWPEVAKVTRKYYAIRYSLLPYWYTLHYKAHLTGRPLIRPLFFEFPEFPELYDNDEQFMVGDALLVVPVLKRGMSGVQFKLPQGVWYDLVEMEKAPVLVTLGLYPIYLDADIQTIPVLLRGGNVILKQKHGLTIRDTMKGEYELLVALDQNGKASGDVYFDDGISSNPGQAHSLIKFNAACDISSCSIVISGYFGHHTGQKLTSLTLLSTFNLYRIVHQITLDHQVLAAISHTSQYMLHIQNLAIDLNFPQDLEINFTI